MKDFPLIIDLNAPILSTEPSPLGEGIQYQQYEVEVEGTLQLINIPAREIDNFEKAITENINPFTRKSLKVLLREYRGVRGQL